MTTASTQEFAASVRQRIDEAEMKGRLAEIKRKDFAAWIRTQLTEIDAQLKDPKAPDSGLSDRLSDLDSLRAYLLPPHEVVVEARIAMADLRSWGVAQEELHPLEQALAGVHGHAVSARDPELWQAQSCLYEILDAYAFWSDYVSTFNRWRWRSVLMLSFALVLMLAIAYSCVASGAVFAGFVFAGAVGAIASVLAKLPGMSTYGKDIELVHRLVVRVVTGTVAAAIGFGLLGSGLLSVSLTVHGTARSFDQIVTTLSSPAANDERGILVAVLLSVAMLLGLSERSLTTFSELTFGERGSDDRASRKPITPTSLIPPGPSGAPPGELGSEPAPKTPGPEEKSGAESNEPAASAARGDSP